MNLVFEEESVMICSDEVRILEHMAQGQARKQIAREMNYHPNTIKRKTAQLYRKLGARNRPHAIFIAIKEGLLRPDA